MTAINLWSLDAKPAKVEAAADGWERLAKAWDAAADRVNDAARRVDGWVGVSAETYEAHRTRFTRDLRTAATQARSLIMALREAAFVTRLAQEYLDTGFSTVSTVNRGVENGQLVFHPADEQERTRVQAAIGDANDVRRWLDGELTRRQATIATAATTLTELDAVWRAFADGATTFTLPSGAETATGVMHDPVTKELIVQTGAYNDTVTVVTGPATNETYVSVNGTRHRLQDSESVVIRTGAGNDTIRVEDGHPVKVTVMSGEGNDEVVTGRGDDRVYAGAGNDVVYTGAGRDLVSGGRGSDVLNAGDGDDLVKGGSGGDVVRGLGGDDKLLAGAGNDYVDGSRGTDVVFGDGGRDIVSGGRDGDILSGGRDDDRFFTGLGPDTVTHGAGHDTATGQTGENRLNAEVVVHVEMTGNPGDRIVLRGTDTWMEQVKADLDFMRATEAGRQQLGEMDRSGQGGLWTAQGLFTPDRTVVIEESVRNAATMKDREYSIEYSPELIDQGSPGPLALYHEMGHVRQYDGGYRPDGTYGGSNTVDHGANLSELANSGIPFVDHDGDPATPEVLYDRQPYESTEARYRAELGIPPRGSYHAPAEHLTE